MSLAEVIALSMAAARARLVPELARLIVPERAWPLAVLLAAWASTKPGLVPAGQESRTPLPGLFSQAFDSLQGELTPFIARAAKPSADSMAVRLAGLSVLLAGMIGRIGAETLNTLLSNSQFTAAAEAINRQYPIPNAILEAFNPMVVPSQARTPVAIPQTKNRIRDFSAFDYPKRDPESDPQFLRRQLDDDDISPEMRMWYEERLAFLGLPKYPSDSEAKTAWQTVLQGSMPPEVRGYFVDALRALEGGSSEEAET